MSKPSSSLFPNSPFHSEIVHGDAYEVYDPATSAPREPDKKPKSIFEGSPMMDQRLYSNTALMDSSPSPLVDLTQHTELPLNNALKRRRYWRSRPVRRHDNGIDDEEESFHYLSGPHHFFHKFMRQYTHLAIAVWLFLFCAELAMVVIYIVQSTRDYNVTWVEYDPHEFSAWFYSRSILSFVLLLQLFFAYSLAPITLIIVLASSIFQIVLFLMSYGPNLGWLSRMYVPLFLRVWPLRQYFLFLIDAIALLAPRNDRYNIIRQAVGPLTQFICFFFCASCIVRIDQTFQGFPMNLGVAMYFIMMTASTVGFGDVVISTTQEGKAITIIFIFFFVALLPTIVNICRVTFKRLVAIRSYRGPSNHFLIYGFVTREDAMALMDEVFQLYPMKCVCFANKQFPAQVLEMERNPQYRLRCTFLIIEKLDDLASKRMRASEAAGIILFPNREEVTTRGDDEVMLASLYFDRIVPDKPQYIWLRYGLHTKLFVGRRASFIDQYAKRTILASSLLLPGIIPFLVNLVRTSTATQLRGRNEPPNLWTEDGVNNWKDLYEYSRRNILLSCNPPASCLNKPLRSAALLMKLFNILVVGVEEAARHVVRLDLNYVLEPQDVLIIIYEGDEESLNAALQRLAKNTNDDGEEEEIVTEEGLTNNSFSAGDVNIPGVPYTDVYDTNINASMVFYPYGSFASNQAMERSFDTEMQPAGDGEGKAAQKRRARQSHPGSPVSRANPSFPQTEASGHGHHPDSGHGRQNSAPSNDQQDSKSSSSKSSMEATLRPDTHSEVGGAEKECETAAAGAAAAAAASAGGTDVSNLRQRNEHVTDLTITRPKSGIFHDSPNTKTESHGQSPKSLVADDLEVFLFVDQTATITKSRNHSVYGEELSRAISQYELYMMMQCLTSIHIKSRLKLLTLRKLPDSFLQVWKRVFGTGLHYIRGQGMMESHLHYALMHEEDLSKVRGILLYCSQFGQRDYGDIPLFAVENNARLIVDVVNKTRIRELRNNPEHVLPEQNLVIELNSFKMCILLTPQHTDEEWKDGCAHPLHFQDSLPFMMGRCFSSNMLQTIMIHAHRDYRILRFFEMVLSLRQTTDELFDPSLWAQNSTASRTLFQLCGNQSLQFATFGHAYDFLLNSQSCIAIGVFRQMPRMTDNLAVPRYFITNPALRMPLLPDDIIYAIDGSGGENVISQPYEEPQAL